MNSTILLNYIGDIPRMSAGMMCPIVQTDYRCQANRTRWSRVGDQAVKTGIHPPILSHTSIATSTLSPVTASEFQLYNQQSTRQTTNFNKKNKLLSKEITVSDKCWKRSTGSVELHFKHKQTHFSSDNNDFTNFETPNLGKISKSFEVKKTPLSSLETLTDSTLYTSQQIQTSVIKYQAKHKKPATTSKRACLLPATSNHAKRPKRCEKQEVCTNYGNDEMDVARIMISDIPFPVVSCNSNVFMYHNALLDSRTTSTSKLSGEITTKRRGTVTDKSNGEITMKRSETLADQSSGEITTKRRGTLADQSSGEITTKRRGTPADQSSGEITTKRRGTQADQSSGEITTKRRGTLADQSSCEITMKRSETLADQSSGEITMKRSETLADQSSGETTMKRSETLADQSSGEITTNRRGTLADQSSCEITTKRRGTLADQSSCEINMNRSETLADLSSGASFSEIRKNMENSMKPVFINVVSHSFINKDTVPSLRISDVAAVNHEVAEKQKDPSNDSIFMDGISSMWSGPEKLLGTHDAVVSEITLGTKKGNSLCSGDADSEKENHSNETGDNALTCENCHVKVSSKEDLISHRTTCHVSNAFIYPCNVCTQVCRSTAGLQKHIEYHANHQKNMQCSICFQEFTKREDLEEHIIANHMEKRPHKCTYCPKTFRDPGSLQKHVRIHTGEKPYKCSACDKSFAEYSSLRKHNRIHTGEQPYKCQYCSKAFSISGNLQRHILIHTGERPYKCSECPKTFNNPSHLRRHEKNLHSKLECEK